jgi:predicted porin
MGNTGGDNRVEFGTRLAHTIWYESPNWSGVSFSALWSPGQNRADDSSNIASGEPECSGGNVPGSGGLPVACNDGAYSDAFSAALVYERGPLYLTAAYERHQKVNRTSDLPTYDARDIANEDAWKVGLQYHFPTQTTVGLIWEDMRRRVDAALDDQNERTRSGYWVALSQVLNPKDSIHFGWAHANKASGGAAQSRCVAGGRERLLPERGQQRQHVHGGMDARGGQESPVVPELRDHAQPPLRAL